MARKATASKATNSPATITVTAFGKLDADSRLALISSGVAIVPDDMPAKASKGTQADAKPEVPDAAILAASESYTDAKGNVQVRYERGTATLIRTDDTQGFVVGPDAQSDNVRLVRYYTKRNGEVRPSTIGLLDKAALKDVAKALTAAAK